MSLKNEQRFSSDFGDFSRKHFFPIWGGFDKEFGTIFNDFRNLRVSADKH